MAEQERPPVARSVAWLRIVDGGGMGSLPIMICPECKTANYPPQDHCRNCLGTDLVRERRASREGVVLAETLVEASLEGYFRKLGPRRVALLRLDAGPVLYAFLPGDRPATGRVLVSLEKGDSVQGVLVARPLEDESGEG